MITPDAPERQYSTRLRTALVLTGRGTAGAYHAGVLRALHEAGVKIDLVAGCGIGAIGAMFAAIDGAARLWEPDGFWKSRGVARFYRWRAPLAAAGWLLAAAAAIFCVPLGLLALAIAAGLAGILLTLVGLEAASNAVTTAFGTWTSRLFAPGGVPTVVPRLVVLALLVAVGVMALGVARDALTARASRRRRHGYVWRLLGSPLSRQVLFEHAVGGLWGLIRGAAPIATPPVQDLGRRYVELLGENLGQPGIRELLLLTHDMDARRDLVFALLSDAHRARFFGRPSPAEQGPRSSEAFDLAGVARDHVLDALAGALALPIATEPHLITFAPEGPWRGETHRTCDRPGALGRLLEEAAAAGAEQVLVVSASPLPGRPHELSSGRAELRGRAGEQLAAFETADLRDAQEHFAGRFAGLFLIRPVHNPLGPLDVGGIYDERSDRRHTVSELVDRGYEDAYRQFIEPIVGAGSDPAQAVQAGDGRRRAAGPV